MNNYEYFIYLEYRCLSTNEIPSSNLIALADYTGLIKYYTLIEYDSTIYNKLGIKYNNKCAYNNDGSYIYYEDGDENNIGTYVLVSSNETKIYLKDIQNTGYLRVVKIIDKYLNEISFSYNVEFNQLYSIYTRIYLTSINNGQVLLEYENRRNSSFDKLVNKIIFKENDQISREVNILYQYDSEYDYIDVASIEYKYKNQLDNEVKKILKEKVYLNSDKKITKIEYLDNSSYNVVKEQVLIDYYEHKTSSVTGFVKNINEETFTKISCLKFAYYNDHTTITDEFSNIITNYYFDSNLNIKEIIKDDTSRVSNYYQEDNLLSSYYQPSMLQDNLKNGGFEDNLNNWTYNENTCEIVEGTISEKCLKINANSVMSQSVSLEKGHNYQINGFIKHSSSSTLLESVIKLNVSYNISSSNSDSLDINTRLIETNIEASLDNTKSNWYYFTSDELTIPNEAFNITSVFKIISKEELYLDNIALTYENEYNYSLIKETFEDSLTNLVSTTDENKFKVSSLNDVELVTVGTTIDHPLQIGTYALKLKGFNYVEGNEKTISKKYLITGSINERYSVGLFVKGKTKETDISKLVVEVEYLSFTKTYEFKAMPYISYFQKVFGTFVTDDDFNSITINYVYGSFSDILIDGIELYKDTLSLKQIYDENDVLISKDNGNKEMVNLYSYGKLSHQITTDNYISYSYNNNDDLVKGETLSGITNDYTYDGRKIKTHKTTYNSEVIINSYEYENNKVKKITDEYGNSNNYTYDYRHRLIKSTNNLNQEINNVYDYLDRILEINTKLTTDSTTYQNNYQYDDYGNLIKVYNSENPKTTYNFEYTNVGNVEKVKVDQETIESNTYDASQRLVNVEFKHGNYQYLYDNKNRIQSIYYQKNNSSLYELLLEYNYDSSNNITRLKDNKNNLVYLYYYDNLSRLVKTVDTSLNQILNSYDSNNRLIKKEYKFLNDSYEVKYINPLQSETKDGYICSIITKYGADIIYGSDLTQGLLGLIGTKTGIVTSTYDTTFKSNVTLLNKVDSYYTYDLLNANSKYIDSIYLDEPYTLDMFKEKLNNNIHLGIWVKPSSSIHETIIFSLYDENDNGNIANKVLDLKIISGGYIGLYISGQKVLETNNWVSLNNWHYISLYLTYKNKGKQNQTTECIVEVNSVFKTYSTTLDLINNVRYVKVGEYVESETDNPSLDINVDYTLRSMPLKIGLLTFDVYQHNNKTLNEFYLKGDNYYLGNVLDLYQSSKTSINNIEYQYIDTIDRLGRIKKESFKKGNYNKFYTTYTYDKTRISKETKSNQDQIEYTYDANQNIITKTLNNDITSYEYDILNRLIKEQSDEYIIEYTYDENGNILTKKETVDNQIINNYIYQYDTNIKDLLVKVIKNQNEINIEYQNTFYPSKINNVDYEWEENNLIKIGNIELTYNGFGLRTKKKTNEKEIAYYYDNSLLIKEEIKTSNNTITLKYIYDSNSILKGVIEGTNIYYYDKDITGNIIGLVDVNGNYVVKYRYDSFGNVKEKQVITECNISTYNSIIYKGYYYDVETGLYLVSSRYYSPELCRWISPDTIEYLDPSSINGLNLYCYCLNNPIMYADPSGNFPVLACVLAATALVGLGLTIGGVASDNNVLTAVGLGITGIAALCAGGLAIAGAIATGAIATGIVGGVTAVAGLGSLGFMSAEIQEATGNGNWIIDSTGMSENLYNGLLLGTASIATLGSIASFGMLATNPMTGFTRHGLEQALIRDGHGVSRKAILNAVKHPLSVINQGSKGIKYVGKLATVVLNGTGKVITTWATTSAGWRNIIILCIILGLINDNNNY